MVTKIITGFVVIASLQSFAYAQSNVSTNILNAEWLPDGKSVCLSVIRFDKVAKTGKCAAYLLDLKTSKLELISKDALDAVPSPDGKQIAFAKFTEGTMRGNADIVIHTLSNHTEKSVASTPSRETAPSWSPDGKKLVYTIESNTDKGPRFSNLSLHTINISTGETKQISTAVNAIKHYNPVWSHKGNLITYYVEKGDDHDQIYLTDGNGSFHTNLTNDTTTLNFYPSWFEEKIIYTQAPNSIVVIDQKGKNKSVLDIKASRANYSAKVNQMIIQVPPTGGDFPVAMVYDLKTKQSTRLVPQELLDSLKF